MNSTYLAPYLYFNGNCREAMQFYQNTLGGDLTVNNFGDIPISGVDSSTEGVLHSALKVHDQLMLMGSDGMPGTEVSFGNNVHLSLAGSDEPWLTNAFNNLSAEGKVDVPLAPQPWGDTFGMLTDKYGVHWMINISA